MQARVVRPAKLFRSMRRRIAGERFELAFGRSDGYILAPAREFDCLSRFCLTDKLRQLAPRLSNGMPRGSHRCTSCTYRCIRVVKAAHFTELRNAVSDVRTLAVLGAYAYTNPAPTAGTTVVKAADLTDLRTALNQARTALFLSAIAYTNPTITAGTSTISAADINDLRNGVK